LQVDDHNQIKGAQMSKEIFPQNDPAFEGFDTNVEKVIKDFSVPGMAVAVIKDDQVYLAKGYGLKDVENQKPVDVETVFAIGSSSKAFTTMTLAILADRGEMKWDTPVKEYMPDFRLFDLFATEHMTPRDLVCHRSGLPRHDLMWYNSPLKRKEIYDRLRYLEPNKDFRAAWQYQNLMFLTAGYLVERISGKTWEEFTQKEVFDRMGMTHSNFSVEVSKQIDNYALPYREEDEKVKLIPFRNIDTVGPAGSINSDIMDMAKWVILHLNGKLGDEEIVSEAQLTELHAPTMVMPPGFMGMNEYKELSESSYGLGWFVQYYRGHKIVHHGGNIDGFSALVSFLPDEKFGVVTLTNLDGNMATMAVTLNIYDRLLGLDQIDWRERWLKQKTKAKEAQEKGKEKAEVKKVQDTKPSHALSAYAGQYQHPGYGVIKFELNDDHLVAEANNLKMNLKHYHYDSFEAELEEMPDARLPVSFLTDFQGNIAEVSIPLEPNVKNIVFSRLPDQTMREKSFLEKFVGRYELDGNFANVVLKGEDTLAISVPGMPETELEPYQGTEFTLKGLSIVRIEFLVNGEGVVEGLDISQPGGVLKAKKIE
jgi:CubicO group peptidase (beta-lactamase class C family)